MLNVLDACLVHEVPELFVASSSEVYQTPPRIPTDEKAPLSIPDPMNPRYSYAAGKITSEMLAINYARTHFERMVIFRPHNVYGPDMGWEHVIPQFALRLADLCRGDRGARSRSRSWGRASETRAFVSIDDFTDGLVILLDRGRHREIYNIGTTEEVAIADLARTDRGHFGREIEIVPGPPAERLDGPPLSRHRQAGRPRLLSQDRSCAGAAGDGRVVSSQRRTSPRRRTNRPENSPTV